MFADFNKAFFPTDNDLNKQKDSFIKYYNLIKVGYMNQGMSAKEAEKRMDEDVENYIKKGKYE